MNPDVLWRAVGSSAEGARRQKVGAWFHRKPPTAAGLEDRETFSADYRRTLAENLLFLDVSGRTLDLLSAAGLQAMPLKGVHFGARFFGDPGVRAQPQVDLLVREKDRERAHGLLSGQGWAEAAPRDPGAGRWLYKKDKVLLGLHGRLRAPGLAAPDLDRLWVDARPARWEGREVLEFTAEDTLLYMAVHKAQDRFSCLADLLDLGSIAEAGVNWAVVVENARRDGVAPHLWLGLSLARELTGADVPLLVLDRLGRGLRMWPVRILKRLCSGSDSVLSPADAALHEAALEGPPFRALSGLAALLFPSKDRLRDAAGASRRRYYASLFGFRA